MFVLFVGDCELFAISSCSDPSELKSLPKILCSKVLTISTSDGMTLLSKMASSSFLTHRVRCLMTRLHLTKPDIERNKRGMIILSERWLQERRTADKIVSEDRGA